MGRADTQAKPVVKSSTLSRWWVVAGVVGLAALAVELVMWLRQPSAPPSIRSSRQITHDGILKQNLVISPDGKQIYFDESPSVDHSKIMRVSTSGGEATPIETPLQEPHVLDVSAQSELLVASDGAYREQVPIWTVSASSGVARQMSGVVGQAAAWEPGGALVFVKGKEFYIAGHDGANPHKLVEAQGPPFALHFSPDGSRFRFTIGDPKSRSTMWQARADGSAMAPIFPWPGWKLTPAPCCGRWTPDGKYFVLANAGDILVVADRPGKHSEPVQLTSGPLRYQDPVPSSDGKTLFALGVQPKAQLVRYDPQSGQFIPFLGGISAGDVDFSRDGGWVTYITYPDGSLWRSRVDGSEPLRLTSAAMQSASPRWSPDGMHIAFSGQRQGEPWKAWLVSKGGSSPEALTQGKAAEAEPTWSSDGKSVAFVRFTQPSHIVLLDLGTRTSSELAHSEGLWHPRWSPDGRSLIAVSGDSELLKIYNRAKQQWRQLASSHGKIGMPAWSYDGLYIFFDDNSTHDSKYLRVRATDGRIDQVASISTVRRYFGNWGFWSGLAPGNGLLLTGDVSKSEVYEFDWRLP